MKTLERKRIIISPTISQMRGESANSVKLRIIERLAGSIKKSEAKGWLKEIRKSRNEWDK